MPRRSGLFRAVTNLFRKKRTQRRRSSGPRRPRGPLSAAHRMKLSKATSRNHAKGVYRSASRKRKIKSFFGLSKPKARRRRGMNKPMMRPNPVAMHHPTPGGLAHPMPVRPKPHFVLKSR